MHSHQGTNARLALTLTLTLNHQHFPLSLSHSVQSLSDRSTADQQMSREHKKVSGNFLLPDIVHNVVFMKYH